MLKLPKVSTSVLALTLVPMLTIGGAAFAQKGEGKGNAGDSAGMSESSPGQSGSAPGLAGNTPGQSGGTPAAGAEPPGQAGTSPGLAGTTPGQSRGDTSTDAANGTVTSGSIEAVEDSEADVTGSVNGSADAHANFGSLISSLNNAGASAQQIRDLTSVGEISIVDASSLTRGSRVNALNNALGRSQVSELREALSSNTAIVSALAESNISLDDVLSATVTADGSVVVYAR